jgi:xanthine dehydrogenase accessory factor
MAFADAIFDGWATLDGRTAVLVKTPAELRHALNIGDAVPVVSRPLTMLLEQRSWLALVDARMRKRAVPERQRGLAPLTVGLGRNFVAGDTVDLAI